MLAARLKDLERDGLATRRRLPAPASGSAYDLTERGRELLPVLAALSEWGRTDLDERRPTDAVRAHRLALPLRAVLVAAGMTGVVDVRTDEGVFHVRLADDSGPPYGDGPAEPPADVRLAVDAATCVAICRDGVSFDDAVREGSIQVSDAACQAGR